MTRAVWATRTSIVAVAATLWVLLSTVASAAETQMSAIANVNIRSAPRTTAPLAGGLYRGQIVTALHSAGGWTTIRFQRVAAYVSSRYVVKGTTLPVSAQVDPGGVRVATADLRLRTGAGLGYPVVAMLPEGTRVTLTGRTAHGFVEVYAKSRLGWASSQYLAKSSSGLPAIIGTRVATADLLVRTTPNPTYAAVGEIRKGGKVAVTGATSNARAQIVYRNAVRWVTARYLTKPVVSRPAVPGLPNITGHRYAITDLLIRSSSTNRYQVIAEVPQGTRLAITGRVQNGRAQIVYEQAVRWVTARYLSTRAPPPVISGSAYAVEKGLRPNAIKVHRAAMPAWPQITTYYGVRPDSIPDHPAGLALDLMLPNYSSAAGKALGRRIADWARANAGSLKIKYVIYDQHIWNILRDREGWRYIVNRGSDSANHKNHVHISVFP